MIPGRIEGATRVCGKSQGFAGLPIRDDVAHEAVLGDAPVMWSAWIPSPEDLAKLNAGAAVHVGIIGTIPPPMLVDVGPAPE